MSSHKARNVAELESVKIDSIKAKLPAYKLAGTKLVIRQGLNAKNEIDISQIKASILESVYQGDSLKQSSRNKLDLQYPDLREELMSLYPDLLSYSIDNIIVKRLDVNRQDTITMAVANFKTKISTKEKERLTLWLKSRVKADSLELLTK